jgi:uncharacterized membrane protein
MARIPGRSVPKVTPLRNPPFDQLKEPTMNLRLEEMHPALVHVPIAFVPVAVGADLVGRVANNRSLSSFARTAIVVGAAGAVASGLSGLIAGEEVNVEGKSRDMLMTHRNLNFLAMLVVGSLALWRVRRDKPSAAYLATGAAATGVLAYTAYLGGTLISKFGVGVAPADGIYRPDAPALGSAPVTEFAKAAATDLVHGVEHMVEEVAQGQLAPAIFGKSRAAAGAASEPGSGTDAAQSERADAAEAMPA